MIFNHCISFLQCIAAPKFNIEFDTGGIRMAALNGFDKIFCRCLVVGVPIYNNSLEVL